MKKLVSILLVAVMLMSVMSVTAFADENDSIDNLLKDQLYYKRFIDEYKYITFYHEEYYHHINETDENSDIDWALIRAATDVMVEPIDPPVPHYCTIGDIVYGTIYYYQPFETGYCVYDVAKDEFLDITNIDIDNYNGLREVFCTGKYGMLIGDIDADGDVSVIDATEIQLIVAKLSTLERNYRVADFNRDGSVDVLDATAIQLHLAGLNNEPDINEEMVIHTSSSYDELWNLPYMADDVALLSFDMEFDKQQFSDVVYNYGVTGECFTVAIIKSNEQYNYLFNENAPKYDDEFFENKWLVVALTRGWCHQARAPITDVAIAGDTLYVRANVYVPEGPTSPTEPFWLSIVSVDKTELLYVTDIVKVK
ncbi:MAG: dockerin type I repeat-containing protein [Ruminococcus sp.]|nr:dockerin type I repeat-containing protein [Ruminococcus sp.]